jgi:hypothetical protein
MYGSVLESFTNQKSPKLKELAKGAEIRNKLIHRPKEVKINAQEANKYVQDVEIAIGHLLTLLHPGDPIMKRSFKPPVRIVYSSLSFSRLTIEPGPPKYLVFFVISTIVIP